MTKLLLGPGLVVGASLAGRRWGSAVSGILVAIPIVLGRGQPPDHPGEHALKLIDRETGAENATIDWRFRVGDEAKIRLLNEMAGDHPMHHPFHIHGAGRFLVLSRDGAPESNLMWHDTVLATTGETVDILLDVTNPGIWMSYCQIAEHHESGMMFSFRVDEAE